MLMPLYSVAALFEIGIDKRSIALGQQLTLTLSSERIDQSLEDIDLRPLQGDFAVAGRAYSDSIERRGRREVRVQSLELRLIALRSGRLTLPPLQIGAARTEPIPIEVSAGNSEFPQVIIRTGYATKLYQRRETLLLLDLYDDSTLQWQPPDLRVGGMILRPLAPSNRVEQIGSTRYRVTRFAWGAMPLQGGIAVVDFGLIDATHFGERVAFRVPAAVANVETVPTYLPLSLHVGKLELTKQILPRELQVGRPAYWIMEVSGTGLSAEGLRKSIRPVGNDRVYFYAPQVEISDQDSGMQHARIVQPLKALAEGRLVLPSLKIAYYDPVRAEVAALATGVQSLSVVDPVRARLRKLAVIASVLILVLSAAWFMRRRIHLMWRRARTKHALRSANSASDFLHEIYAADLAGRDKLLRLDLTPIEAIVYGRGDATDFQRLRAQFLARLALTESAKRSERKTAAEQILVR